MSRDYVDEPVTLRELLHQLTEDYTLMDEPVHIDVWDGGQLLDCLVTGISVRMWRGPDGKGPDRPVQSLTFERNRDGR